MQYTKQEIRSRVIEALNDVLPNNLPENASDSINIYDDLYLDSMDLISVFMILETECGVNLEEHLVERRQTHIQTNSDSPLARIVLLKDIIDLFYEFQ